MIPRGPRTPGPLRHLDPRAKVLAAFAVVLGVVLGAPPRLLELLLLSALLAAATRLAGLPLLGTLKRSALVLPIAGGIGLFAPLAGAGGSWSVDTLGHAYRSGWIVAWGIVSKAWLSAWLMLVLAGSTSAPRLLQALTALHVPAIFVTLLTFLYRYADVLGEQLRSMRHALASRGWAVTGRRRALLYGHLAGNLFIRAYERGERVHAAMVSRGFDGALPGGTRLTAGAADVLLLVTAVMAAAAILLY